MTLFIHRVAHLAAAVLDGRFEHPAGSYPWTQPANHRVLGGVEMVFSIPLENLQDELKMDPMILQVALTAPDMIELLAPVYFKARAFLRQDGPP